MKRNIGSLQNSSILISLSSSSQKFKFLKYSKNVSISDKLCKEKRNQFNMARLSYNRVNSGANKNAMNLTMVNILLRPIVYF
jgi:hypothetical protein